MDTIKIVLAGVAGFVLYEWLKGSTASAVLTSTPTNTVSAPGVVAPVATATTNLTNAQLSTLKSLNSGVLLGVAGGLPASTMFNVSQWNYYMSQLTGIPGQFLGDNGQPMDVNSYLSLLTTWASRQTGMGQIINLSSIYGSKKAGSGFGDEEFISRLSGLGMLVDAPENNAAWIDEGPFGEGAARNGSYDASTRAFYLADGYPV